MDSYPKINNQNNNMNMFKDSVKQNFLSQKVIFKKKRDLQYQ